MDQEYTIGKLVGKGAYAKVYRAESPVDGSTVAIKKIDLEGNETALKEVVILTILEHPNVIDIIDHDYDEEGRELRIVMDFAAGDLHLAIHHGTLCSDDELIVDYMAQILRGVAYLHENNIVHQDLKPANILVMEGHKVKIGDFGTSVVSSKPIEHDHEIVTRWYRPLELMLGVETYTNAIDLWSLGCIYFEMVYGKVLFAGNNEVHQANMILETFGTPLREEWPGFFELKYHNHDKVKTFDKPDREPMKRMDNDVFYGLLQLNPESRMTAETALETLTIQVTD
jgi:serine/threonine protein kinase